jgi:hypothetical protein
MALVLIVIKDAAKRVQMIALLLSKCMSSHGREAHLPTLNKIHVFIAVKCSRLATQKNLNFMLHQQWQQILVRIIGFKLIHKSFFHDVVVWVVGCFIYTRLGPTKLRQFSL